MKAIVYTEHGGPEVLKYKDVPEPEISPYDVLIRVRACALNHLDLWVRRGMPGVTIPLPHIPGSDISGEVARIGEKVTNVKVGDRVLLQPGISCGQCEKCLAGEDNLCRAYTLFGRMVARRLRRIREISRRQRASRSPQISASKKPPRFRSFLSPPGTC